MFKLVEFKTPVAVFETVPPPIKVWDELQTETPSAVKTGLRSPEKAFRKRPKAVTSWVSLAALENCLTFSAQTPCRNLFIIEALYPLFH